MTTRRHNGLDFTRPCIHDNMRVRHHKGTSARQHNSRPPWGGLYRALRALVGGLEYQDNNVTDVLKVMVGMLGLIGTYCEHVWGLVGASWTTRRL